MALSGVFTDPSETSGPVVQVTSATYSAVATGTTVLPFDDTVPQNTEGDQYMTLAIVPKSSLNRLHIEIVLMASPNIAAHMSVALFQDSTAGALAAVADYQTTGTGVVCLKLVHDMLANTTNSTTFNVRAGLETAGTTTFNGESTARRFGGVSISSITIWEYRSTNIAV